MGGVSNWKRPTPDEDAKNSVRLAYLAKLKELGWVPGQNLRYESLYTEGQAERVLPLTEELVRKPVDLIVASSTIAAVTAARAPKTIPVVMAASSAYPVETGLIKSFARPGGNVTGVAFWQGIEVQSKLAQFVREILPDAKRPAWIASPADLIKVSGGEFRPEPYYAKISQSLGLELGYFEWRRTEDVEPVFAAIAKWRAQAVIVEPAGLAYDERVRIAELATRAGIPSFYGATYHAPARGLLAYSPVISDAWVRAAVCIDRILRGARPADLPVETPNTLELVVNMKTAKALGVTVPRTIILRADRVIE